MAIPQHTIDQILDRTDIVDLIGQRVKLKKSGRTYSGCCPFHQEKSPSFHVYRDKQYFHCFGCQANGNAIRFLMDIDHRNFIDVMKDLSSQTGIELPKDNHDSKKLSYKRETTKPAPAQASTPTPVQNKTAQQPSSKNVSDNATHFETDPFEAFQNLEGFDAFDGSAFAFNDQYDQESSQEGNLYDLLENVALYYEKQLPHSKIAQQYFRHRGLGAETVKYWRLGYAPEDWQHLEKAFPQDIEGLKLLGLIRTSDSGRDFDLLRERVIFPIRDAKGRVVGFGGRALNDEIKPKYINSPDSEVFHKNQLLYGLYEGRKLKAQNWLMVEGYMDVIALQQAGIPGAVATLGTASNADHLTTLFKQNSQITIAFDGDAAGQKAARRTLDIALPLLNDGRELKFFIMPKEHDPDSLVRKEGLETFNRMWQQAPLLSDFIFALLSQQYEITTPEGKSQVMAELNQLTDLLPKHGSYRYLIRQFFKDKLGFNKKWQPKVNHDASLSFLQKIGNEEFAVSLLINNPMVYTQFEVLRAYINDDSILRNVLDSLDKIFDSLPDDQELAIYYVLGACSKHHAILAEILKQIDLSDTLESPEKCFNRAREISEGLNEKYLKIKLKNPKTLIESANLRRQLNELTKKIGLKLVNEE
ncbi:DNA primase [Acinetobacter sp. TGL-Y2]|uniref:DNA primase n=1 Tax=Acinetobacter sp. TGL-Y2 TaxID=1407071 RepID=UPI0007A67F18|nr:CHC2 zinc finger domain-containing protein [Acinetobacter sp. TGL-Y2]AMW78226.1 DNA primase [Acinetobacter sp. TGL-Y2]